MGTNYDWVADGNDIDLHIGKSSGGWVFALHVYPGGDEPELPRNLEEWIGIWTRHEHIGHIQDEDGGLVSTAKMLKIICNRSFQGRHAGPSLIELGPNNLRRWPVDGIYTIGHGAGTWDLHVGEFS
jgi:hypothetical protein